MIKASDTSIRTSLGFRLQSSNYIFIMISLLLPPVRSRSARSRTYHQTCTREKGPRPQILTESPEVYNSSKSN